jgi:hypothetical protein
MTFTNATGKTLVNTLLYKDMACTMKPGTRVELNLMVDGKLQRYLMRFKTDASCSQLKAAIEKHRPVA